MCVCCTVGNLLPPGKHMGAQSGKVRMWPCLKHADARTLPHSISVSLPLFYTHTPVSYTHLDVYKRQSSYYSITESNH